MQFPLAAGSIRLIAWIIRRVPQAQRIYVYIYMFVLAACNRVQQHDCVDGDMQSQQLRFQHVGVLLTVVSHVNLVRQLIERNAAQ